MVAQHLNAQHMQVRRAHEWARRRRARTCCSLTIRWKRARRARGEQARATSTSLSLARRARSATIEASACLLAHGGGQRLRADLVEAPHQPVHLRIGEPQLPPHSIAARQLDDEVLYGRTR